MRFWVLMLLSMPWLGGCQTALDNSRSYVEPLPPSAEAQLGKAIAGYVSQTWPAARTKVLLIPPQLSALDNALTTTLTAELLNAGFAVGTPETAFGSDAHHLKYCVTADDVGILVRLTLDEAPVARYYAMGSNGEISALFSLTVRN